MGEIERKLFGQVGDLEPGPKSDGLHDNRAVALGGRMTWQYAWDLSGGSVGRDYVARALLARGLDPAVVKPLVVEVFEARRKDYERRGARFIAISAVLLVVAGLAVAGTIRWGNAVGLEDVEIASLVIRRAILPAAFGVGCGAWGWGLRRRATKM